MICGPNTCGTDYLDKLVFEQKKEEENDFINSLKHVKCKLIQLVRDQVRKSQEKPGGLCCSTQFNSTAELYEAFPLERKSSKYFVFNEMNSKEDASMLHGSLRTNPSKNLAPNCEITSAPCLRNSRRLLYYIILLIVAIVAILFAMHFFLIRGYFCNKGQPCITTFRYTHAKHALF